MVVKLMIYENIQNEVLKKLLDKIEAEFGCILTNVGGTVNDKWISPKAITALICELDKEVNNSI